jgi:predicted dehydrogenase
MHGNGLRGNGAPHGTLRIGLVGAGRRGQARAAALAGLPGVALVGVADADGARARVLADAHGTRPFASTLDLLADADAVCLAVPAAERFLLARAAAGEGTHVFLEWPPATGLDEAERLGHLAEEASVEVAVARPLPVGFLLDGRPADWRPRLLALTLDAGTGPDDAPGALPWPHRLAGALDLCVALARSADVQRVEAEADRDGARLRAVALGLRFRNGVYAQAVLHERARAVDAPERFRLDASGAGFRLSARALDGPVCVEREASSNADERAANPAPAAAFGPAPSPLLPAARELADFVAAVAAGRPAPVSILDALHTLRLVERLMERLR